MAKLLQRFQDFFKNKEQLFVFSDIHGCASELKLLINKIPLKKNATLIFLGDYVDRGAQSKEVIDTLLELKKNYKTIFLMGNHEEMFMNFLKDPKSAEGGSFIYNGGSATLASYSDGKGHFNIPQEHLDFLNQLEIIFQTDDYFFVHAGVPNIPLDQIDPKRDQPKLLWIRDNFFNSSFNWSKKIIHGHTPIKKPFISEKRINIDTGCCFNNKLTALELPSQKLYSVQKMEQMQNVYLRDQDSRRRSVRFEGTLPVYIQIKTELAQFETVNYSDFGMLIHNVIHPKKQLFVEGEIIGGEIGNSEDTRLNFKGRIIRVLTGNNSLEYAIEFIQRPEDNNIKDK